MTTNVITGETLAVSNAVETEQKRRGAIALLERIDDIRRSLTTPGASLISDRELCRRAGISENAIGAMRKRFKDNGELGMTGEVAIALSRLSGLSTDYILTGKDGQLPEELVHAAMSFAWPSSFTGAQKAAAIRDAAHTWRTARTPDSAASWKTILSDVVQSQRGKTKRRVVGDE